MFRVFIKASAMLAFCFPIIAQTVNVGEAGTPTLFDASNMNQPMATPRVAPNYPTAVQSISWYAGYNNGASPSPAQYAVGIGSVDPLGHPLSPLCSAQTGTQTYSVGWVTVPVTGCPILQPSATFDIIYEASTAAAAQGYIPGVCKDSNGSTVFTPLATPSFSGFSDPFGTTVNPSQGLSCYSMYVTLAPVKPYVLLQWTPSSSSTAEDPGTVTIQRSSGNAAPVTLTSTAPASGPWADTTISSNTTYAYTLFYTQDGFTSIASNTPTVSVTSSLVTPTVTIVAPSLQVASSAVITVTVSDPSGVPTGTVMLSISSGTPSTVTLSLGTAQFPVSLPVGTNVFTATYTPDAGSASKFSTATGSLSVSVDKPLPVMNLVTTLVTK